MCIVILFSFIELIEFCLFLCCLVLFVSTFAKRLAGKATHMISFTSKGFLYKNQMEELFIVMDSFGIFPACYILTFII